MSAQLLQRDGVIWRDYTPTDAERDLDWQRKRYALHASDRFMQPASVNPSPKPVRGCAYDPSSPDDYMDADGKQLNYAALSGGW